MVKSFNLPMLSYVHVTKPHIGALSVKIVRPSGPHPPPYRPLLHSDYYYFEILEGGKIFRIYEKFSISL